MAPSKPDVASTPVEIRFKTDAISDELIRLKTNTAGTQYSKNGKKPIKTF